MRDITTQMASDYERIRKGALEDPGTAGDEGEMNWKKLFEDWLSPAYSVVTKGRIINERDEASPQVDVIILKPSYPRRLKDQLYHLAGGVAAAFECKTTLKAEHVSEAVRNAVALRRLLRPRSGSAQRELDSGIIFGLLAHSHSWKGGNSTPVENIRQRLIAADNNNVSHPREMLDLICVSDLCYFSAIKATWLGPFPQAMQVPSLAQYGNRGAPSTGYISFDPDVTGAGTPVGALLCDLMHQLALEDSSLRSMSAYFTGSGLQAIGQLDQRLWDENIYSPEMRSQVIAEGGRFIKGIY